MSKFAAILAAGLALGLPGRAAAQGLAVGDPAPKLEVKEFVKGDPVAKLDPGTVYVIEFWATWCGPCRTSIPHVSELQARFKDKGVVVIGVSVSESDPADVKPFVKEMGDKMAYRVAVDDLGEGGKGGDGKMAKNWMEAADQSGLPTAFIVDKEGKVAWIGHPMRMDKPLAAIAAGKWDLQAAAAEFKKEQALKAKMRTLRARLQAAQKSGDPKQVLAVIDEAVKDDPALERSFAQQKLYLLIRTGDADKAVEYGNRLTDEVFKSNDNDKATVNANALNELAWGIVENPPEKADPRLLKLALRMAEKADKLAEGKDGAIADTLAKAYYETGDPVKALEHQERAVKLIKGTPLEDDKTVQQRLELYKKAAKK
jgi:thiol-disulfide isomerase/thioredoxin